MRISTNILLIISLLFLTACKEDINPLDVFKNENDLKLTIYTSGDYVTDIQNAKIINRDSEVISNLKSWLINNSKGWKSTVASWATPDISLTGKDFRLLVFKDFVVIGFTNEKGKPRQCFKSISKSELDFLIK
jgi:hypothetical protein